MTLPARLQNHLTAFSLKPDQLPDDPAAWTAALNQISEDYRQYIREHYLLNRLIEWLPETRQEAISQRADIPLTIRQRFQLKRELNAAHIIVQTIQTVTPNLQNLKADASAIHADRHAPQSPMTDEQFKRHLSQLQLDAGIIHMAFRHMLELACIHDYPIIFHYGSPSEIDFDEQCRMRFTGDAEKQRRFDYQGTSEPCMFSDLYGISHKLPDYLASNALKFSPEDSVIRIRMDTIEDDLLFTMQDEGIGIPEAEIPHIFEPFYRASNAQHIPGTGLGLTVVKLMVDLYGGTVNIESRLNAGTTVSVRMRRKSVHNL